MQATGFTTGSKDQWHLAVRTQGTNNFQGLFWNERVSEDC